MRPSLPLLGTLSACMAVASTLVQCTGDDNPQPGAPDASYDGTIADTGKPDTAIPDSSTAPDTSTGDTGTGSDAGGDAADAAIDARDAADAADASTDALDAADAADVFDASCALDGGEGGLLCGAACIDLANDPANCGVCGISCEAGAVCHSAQCTNVAGTLGGLRWELPCTGAGSGPVNCATSVDGGASETLHATIQGTAGQSYAVTLRFRGIVEQKTYSGGTTGLATGAAGDGGVNQSLFLVGGTPSGDTWNIYELDVGDPKDGGAAYFLNAGASGTDQVWLVDYRAVLRMTAGTTVTLIANSVEGIETKNIGPDGGPIVVPGVSPAPASFNGQFVQMDVESVVPVP